MPVFPPVTTTTLPSSLFWDSQYLVFRFFTNLNSFSTTMRDVMKNNIVQNDVVYVIVRNVKIVIDTNCKYSVPLLSIVISDICPTSNTVKAHIILTCTFYM